MVRKRKNKKPSRLFWFFMLNESPINLRRPLFLKNGRLWLNEDPDIPEEPAEEELEAELEEA